MSGGAYDYLLYADDVYELAKRREALERMAERLEGLPWAPGAARETRRLCSFLDRIDARLQASDDLRQVWKAIEWWDSYDSGEDTTRELVAQYEDGLL